MNPVPITQEELLEKAIEIEGRVAPPQRMRVPTTSMFVDDAYQRRPDDRRIARMAANWRPGDCGVPTLSYRKPHRYATIDGQHRTAAAVVANRGEPVDFDCLVYTGLDVADEAYLFWFLNASENRKPMTVLDVFRARLAWGEPRATEIQGVLGEFSMHVPRNTGGSGRQGAITAVASLDDIVRVEGKPRLRLILTILSGAYDMEPLAYRAGMLRGLDAFLTRYETDASYKHARMMDKLRATPLRTFDRIVLTLSEDRSATGINGNAARWGIALQRIYNEGFKGPNLKHRLPEWTDPAVAGRAMWRGRDREAAADRMRTMRASFTHEERSEQARLAAVVREANRQQRNGTNTSPAAAEAR